MRVNLSHLTFAAIFVLTFVLAGPLTLLNLPFRLSPVALLALPLVLRIGIRRDDVFTAFLVLSAAVIASAVVNGSTILQTVIFLRSAAVAYLIYRLVDIYLAHPERLARILRWSILVAVVQLPIFLVERMAYTHIPAAIVGHMAYVDISLGTFRDDASMAFFLNLLIVVFLFAPSRNPFRRYRWPIVFWLSLTVVLCNSEISKLVLILVWGVYIARHFSVRTLAISAVGLGIIAAVLIKLSMADQLLTQFTAPLSSAFTDTNNDVRLFLTGNYARGAALMYYLKSNILWFGGGPLRYSDPIHRILMRGNTGHIFTYYSEVGLIGWLASIYIFSRIAFPRRHPVHIINLLAFVSIQIMSFTTQILNHVAVILIYCIICSVVATDGTRFRRPQSPEIRS